MGYGYMPFPTLQRYVRSKKARTPSRGPHYHRISCDLIYQVRCDCPTLRKPLPKQVEVRLRPSPPYQRPIAQRAHDRRQELKPPPVLVHTRNSNEPQDRCQPDCLKRIVYRRVHDRQRPVGEFRGYLGRLQDLLL